MQPLQCVLQPQLPKRPQLRCKTHRNSHQCGLRQHQPAPAAHTRYLSSPAAATSHRKTQGFVLRLSPQHKTQSTFMISTLTAPFIECRLTLLSAMWCQLTHHHSLSIVSHVSLLCDVNSHTTIHWVQSHTSHCYVMSTLTPPFIEYSRTLLMAMWCQFTPPFIEYSLTLLIIVWCKRTHLHSLSIVLHFSSFCDVNSQTTLHWV